MLGDIHRNFANLSYQIKTKNITNCTMIQVGDFGAGYVPGRDIEILEDLNKFLSVYNVTMYVIRGNHDDPFFFKGNHIWSHLKLMPDYSQIEVDGHNILLVGGATSIDRNGSLEKMQIAASVGVNQPLYWFDEIFVLDEEKLKNIKGVDIVVTHTAPEWCYPDNRNGFSDFVKNFTDDDIYLLKDLTEERNLVTKMFNILKDNGNHIQKHFYGNFHKNMITVNGMTTHYLLGIGEMMEVDNYEENDYEEIFKNI